MGAIVRLTAYLAPKAAELLKEGAKHIWEVITDGDIVEKIIFIKILLVSSKTFKPYLAFYFPRTADILNV